MTPKHEERSQREMFTRSIENSEIHKKIVKLAERSLFCCFE